MGENSSIECGRPLNYFGSKERMVPVIHDMIPPGMSTWVDLFCGSAIVTLAKRRHPREVLNDRHHEVVNLFEVLRSDRLGELLAMIELTPYAQEQLRLAYDGALPADDQDPVNRAWTFLIRSWLGRGGNHKTGFRWSKGQTTSPEMVWARMPSRLAAVAERLRGICIRCEDAIKLVADYDDPSCIIFSDPPYPGAVGRRYAVRMDDAQHEALAERLSACRARIILTMIPGTIYARVLSSWHVTPVTVQGGGNAKKTEHIMTNFEPLPLLARASGKGMA